MADLPAITDEDLLERVDRVVVRPYARRLIELASEHDGPPEETLRRLRVVLAALEEAETHDLQESLANVAEAVRLLGGGITAHIDGQVRAFTEALTKMVKASKLDPRAPPQGRTAQATAQPWTPAEVEMKLPFPASSEATHRADGLGWAKVWGCVPVQVAGELEDLRRFYGRFRYGHFELFLTLAPTQDRHPLDAVCTQLGYPFPDEPDSLGAWMEVLRAIQSLEDKDDS